MTDEKSQTTVSKVVFDNLPEKFLTEDFNKREIVGRLTIWIGLLLATSSFLAVLLPAILTGGFTLEYLSCQFLKVVFPLVIFEIPPNHGFLENVFHKGLHVFAAHRYAPQSIHIHMENNKTYLDAPVYKEVWLKFILFPLLLPLIIFIVTFFANPSAALSAGLIMCCLSSKDLASGILVWREKNVFMVHDCEKGLICYFVDGRQ
jgi:hypothetical protein